MSKKFIHFPVLYHANRQQIFKNGSFIASRGWLVECIVPQTDFSRCRYYHAGSYVYLYYEVGDPTDATVTVTADYQQGAGSLLEFVLEEHDFSMPVVRVGFLYIEPMSFIEFLGAPAHELLAEHPHLVSVRRVNIHLHLGQVFCYTAAKGKA